MTGDVLIALLSALAPEVRARPVVFPDYESSADAEVRGVELGRWNDWAQTPDRWGPEVIRVDDRLADVAVDRSRSTSEP